MIVTIVIMTVVLSCWTLRGLLTACGAHQYSMLGTMRCPGNLFKLVKTSLSERKISYRIDILSLVHEYNVGFPQGSNSEPFFWNLVPNSLFELDLDQFVKLIAYSDDFALLIEAPNVYMCGRRAERALERIEEWAESHKLTFSPEKTVSVCFRKVCRLVRKRNSSTPPRMHFLGVSIKMVQSAKYLGVMIDSKLNGMAHVAYLKESVQIMSDQSVRSVEGAGI